MWWIGQFIVCGAALAVAASGRRYIGGARVDPSVDA
jgi:hypothetical protein